MLFFWASDVFAAERIHHPKVGVLYVYNARLAAVDISPPEGERFRGSNESLERADESGTRALVC
jgi:hypothetical protein